METFLKELGLPANGRYSQGTFVVDLTDDGWSKAVSTLERSDLVEEDEESSIVTYETSVQQFICDEYTITLIGDLEQDRYRLTIREN